MRRLSKILRWGKKPQGKLQGTSPNASGVHILLKLPVVLRSYVVSFLDSGTVALWHSLAMPLLTDSRYVKLYLDAVLSSTTELDMLYFRSLVLERAGLERDIPPPERRLAQTRRGVIEAALNMDSAGTEEFAMKLHERHLHDDFAHLVSKLKDNYLKTKFRIVYLQHNDQFESIVQAGGSYRSLMALQTAKLFFLRDNTPGFVKMLNVVSFDDLVELQTQKFYHMVKHCDTYLDTIARKEVSFQVLADYSFQRFYDITNKVEANC
ncbi:unnamed protein product [Chrysoparadoxa australica]